ncbi:MAG: glutaredoxin family protein [Bacteroidales bacterium]|nr:glutaredoxin family protein [Bacteroidales bacterium]
MKKFLLLIMITTLIGSLSVLSSCKKSTDDEVKEEPPKKEWTILLYGRPSCGICSALKADLNSANIAFTEYDVDTQSDKNSEMWAKLSSIGHTGSVGLPVVDVIVDGKSNVFIRPSVEVDIKPLIE